MIVPRGSGSGDDSGDSGIVVRAEMILPILVEWVGGMVLVMLVSVGVIVLVVVVVGVQVTAPIVVVGVI